jgi:cytidine deaminase
MGANFDNPNNIELFFGIAGPIGTNLNQISSSLQNCLREVNFDTKPIVISGLLKNIGEFKKDLKDNPEDDRINSHMDKGNEFRKKLKRADALAILALSQVQEKRKECKPGSMTAYIFKSLKNPKEVDLLREVYRSSFFFNFSIIQ